MKTLDLNGSWQFRAIDAYGTLPGRARKVTRWMEGTVPGTVHTDLLANRKIPDPFYRMNENDVQWVDSQQWLYRRVFTVPSAFLEEDALELLARGLDTYADIRVNGATVGHTSDMFVEHRFDVKRLLHAGKNTIEILFDSPSRQSKALEKKGGALHVALEPHRVYVRKAQYSFSWDWGPKLTTSGIWRGIAIEGYSRAVLRDPFVRVRKITKTEAIVEISVDVHRVSAGPLALRLFVAGGDWSDEHVTAVQGTRGVFTLRIPDPELWWPNGYGEQPLYGAIISLLDGSQEIHELSVPFALRTVRLLQEKDREGKSFIMEVNGRKIFCKGADWIPSDSFIPRIADTTYHRLLMLAKDAHMNMIRVWGGGIYEQDIFYELCDRFGLMVWQDFMFACGEYPEEPWFLQQVEEEATKAVKRLRNHPSIVLWCGNNECEWLFCTDHPEKSPDDMNGATIFRDILPGVCSRFDNTRPYWRSSPFGEGFPNSESNGNHHQWSVWSFWKDYPGYEEDRARFVTEFGFQAPAHYETFVPVTTPADRHPQSKVMEHHNKQVEGTERLMRFQAAHFRLGGSLERFIYQGQLVQAEALKCAVEHWRRRKFNTAGALFWQLNDCWPVSSWAVVDSALRPKAAYYYAKKFYAPLMVTFSMEHRKHAERGALRLWMTSDRAIGRNCTLEVNLQTFEGARLWSKRGKISVRPDRSEEVLLVPEKALSIIDPSCTYLLARVFGAEGLLSENRFYFDEPKHLDLGKGKVAIKLDSHRKGEYNLLLRTKRLVKNFRVEVEGEDVLFDDNYFDIDPGIPKVVRFSSTLTTGELKRKLRFFWLT